MIGWRRAEIARRDWRTLRRFFQFIALVGVAAFCHLPVRAQEKSPASSDLARQNRDEVAAPAIQIKTILMEDPGLMVAIKQWVAQDATDHGQLLNEDDLTDAAIFDRL